MPRLDMQDSGEEAQPWLSKERSLTGATQQLRLWNKAEQRSPDVGKRLLSWSWQGANSTKHHPSFPSHCSITLC